MPEDMIIFDGRDIRVVGRLFDRCADRLIITFTGRAAAPPVKMGFGENYLLKRQISAVHFISKDNHWWQTPEAIEAVEEVRKHGLLQGRTLTLYGSSMGAYAALMLSKRIKPQGIILFSPQFSIDGQRVPFETRWRNYAAKLTFDYDDMAAGIDHDAEIKAVFDPFFRPDTQHIELIEKLRPLDRIVIPFAGHNTARALEELGIVTKVTDPLLAGSFDAAQFRRTFRELRPGSSLFWYGFSETLDRRGHHAAAALAGMIAGLIMESSGRMKDPVLRRDILRRAIRAACKLRRIGIARRWLALIEPVEKHPHSVSCLKALIARADGDWKQVLTHATEALAGHPGDEDYFALKLEAQVELGDAANALAWCEQHIARVKRSGALLMAYAKAIAGMQQWQGSLDITRLVFRFDRRCPRARTLATRCWSALGRPEAAEKQLGLLLPYDIADGQLAREIVDLLEKGGSRGPAKKFLARHERFARLADSVLAAFEAMDWSKWPAQVPELRTRFLHPRKMALAS